MIRIHILIITLFSLSIISYANVSNKDLKEIRDLTKAGKYKKALKKHLWFHEESKTSPGMGGVRLSFAINAWLELSQKYPPALDALIKVRDDNEKILLSGKGNFSNFHDLLSINRALGKSNNTYELFLHLDKQDSEQAKSYYIVAEDLLITNKKYKLCSKYIGDPIYKYENLRHTRELQISFGKNNAKLNNPSFIKYRDDNFVNGVIKLIEVLVAIDRKDEAIEIQKKALTYFQSEQIKNSIN